MKKYLATIAIVFLAGCQSTAPKQEFSLATDAYRTTQSQSNTVLAVSEFGTVGLSLNSDMVYTRTPNLIESYTLSEWAEPPHRIVKNLLINSLNNTGNYKAVVSLPSTIKSNLRLTGDINQMIQVFEDKKSYVDVSLTIHLQNSTSQQLLFTKTYNDKEPSETLNAEGGVAAYNRLFKRMMSEIASDLQRYSK